MGTKIIVVQLKELIKTAVFAVIGILLIILLIYFFIPKDNNKQALYIPGIYSSEIVLHNNPVSIEVTVSENEIEDIQLMNMGETQEVFYPLFEPAMEELAKEIIDRQSLEVSTSTDTSVTSQILLDAVGSALEKAKPED